MVEPVVVATPQEIVEKRRARSTLAGTLLVATAAFALVGCGNSSDAASGDDSSANVEAQVSTATVTREDLVETVTLQGTLGYGAVTALATNSTGVVTALPEVGDIVEPGDILFEVNGKPVVLLEGDTPPWRPFASGMSDGADIELLEQNLFDLGYVDGDLNIDRNLTSNTLDAIEALWDDVLNRDLDPGDPDAEPESFNLRRIDLGEVVFAPGPIRIAQNQVALGSSITPAVIPFQTTGNQQVVSLAIRPADRELFDVGTAAEVELPGGEVVPGEVTDVADVATRLVDPASGQTSDPTIAVEVTMTSSPEGAFDAAPVEVEVVETVTAGVLTVPAAALVALAEGGNAVELVDGDTTRLIGVDIGRFADGRVEVSGDLNEGDTVVVPGL
jgi:hypothetical protein